jgi:hypothetical protein
VRFARTLITVLLAVAGAAVAVPPTAGGELPEAMPLCPRAAPETSAPPPGLPSLHDPTACRARATRVEPVDSSRLPLPRPGYHHLGATTVDEWSGVLGRFTVRDPRVRAGTFDFVAARFMAKRTIDPGQVAWLEVGWAETGWSGGGAQRIYTFDSRARSWVFYEEYGLAAGDRVWVYLESGGPAWRAWLWWGDRWQLLAAPELPLGDRALLEQYVEVHQDGAGAPTRVPRIRVDSVQVRSAPDGGIVDWRPESVPTVTPFTTADYCLDWHRPYQTWSAGTCPAGATVQE